MSEYVISFLLVVLVSVFTVYPLFLGYGRGNRDACGPEAQRLAQLCEKRDLYSSSIKDIELDRDMGKLSERDYAELVSRYREKEAAASKLISRLQSEAGNGNPAEDKRTSPFEAPAP